jgi:hypothetical protein
VEGYPPTSGNIEPVNKTSGNLYGGGERPRHWDAEKTEVNPMRMKELCDKINNMPTLLAVVNINGFEKTVCSWVPYDHGKKEVTLLVYHGPLDIRRTYMVEEGNVKDLSKEYVTTIRYNDNIRVGNGVTAYFTEYDFMEPKQLPDWAAMVWVNRQKVNIREERVLGKAFIDLNRKVHDVELEIRAGEVVKKLENEERIRYVKSLTDKHKPKVK